MKILTGGLAALALFLFLPAGHASGHASAQASVSTSSALVADVIDWP
ncbi:hypothetical protein HLK59_24355 [Streptomyces sp. S3(2020)]|nr:hypothetical protein [Streptomyces sp. S3(2020)]NNN33434.1 hypothetical protein [Streptomyces sp. S3(2020)]